MNNLLKSSMRASELRRITAVQHKRRWSSRCSLPASWRTSLLTSPNRAYVMVHSGWWEIARVFADVHVSLIIAIDRSAKGRCEMQFGEIWQGTSVIWYSHMNIHILFWRWVNAKIYNVIRKIIICDKIWNTNMKYTKGFIPARTLPEFCLGPSVECSMSRESCG